jgi:hypothetical protein
MAYSLKPLHIIVVFTMAWQWIGSSVKGMALFFNVDEYVTTKMLHI